MVEVAVHVAPAVVAHPEAAQEAPAPLQHAAAQRGPALVRMKQEQNEAI